MIKSGYKKLFEPLQVKSMRLKNRIMMAAVATKLGTEFGAVTNRNVEFYEERARGETALIVIENTCVDWPLGKAGVAPLRLDHDKYITGLNRLVEAVQTYGTCIATQLQHAGAQTNLNNTEGQQPLAPSELPLYGVKPKVMTVKEIHDLQDKFAEAAERTKMAGFDCVEIHGAHGYIFTQFISPALNKRRDEYGGSLENRMRFSLEVLKKVRRKVGENYPIIFRFSADEHIPDGLPLEEAQEFARRLEQAGADMISVTAGMGMSRYWIFPPMGLSRACNRELGLRIKRVVSVPVALVGRINNPSLAEELLDEGACDVIALGRPLLADPHYAAKARAGKPEEIRPCISCNNGCIGRTHHHMHIGCDVNAQAGFEGSFVRTLAPVRKKVVVIGGGPAGLEAAAEAAGRGHHVVLYEEKELLGGSLLDAAKPYFKKEIESLCAFLIAEARRKGVQFKQGYRADLSTVLEEKPDAVIVAVGGRERRLEGNSLVNSYTAVEALRNPEKMGKKIVVAGGGEVGCETALHLSQVKSVKICLVEELPQILSKAEAANRLFLMELIDQASIEVILSTRIIGVSERGVEVKGPGGSRALEADTLVTALGYTGDHSLADQLSPHVEDIRVVGDAAGARRIWHAIHEGSFAGRTV